MNYVHFIAHARSPISLLLILILFSLIFYLPAQAQEDLAAVLTITQNTVEIRRAGTSEWIALPPNAVTPFGVGDSLRTNEFGRAYLQVGDSQQLILPRSTYALDGLREAADGELIWETRLTGRIATRLGTESDQLKFDMFDFDLVQGQGDFLIHSIPDQTAYVVAAGGSVTLMVDEQTHAIPAYHGLRMSDPLSPLIRIEDVPINPARVEGELEGCDGEIQSAGDVDLRVRAGPSDRFFYMGAIPDSTPIKLMGFARMQDGIWYRFQFLSDFGWLLGSAIQTDCANLPELSPQGLENAAGIINWQAVEVDLLSPYFGQPSEDVWFYRQ